MAAISRRSAASVCPRVVLVISLASTLLVTDAARIKRGGPPLPIEEPEHFALGNEASRFNMADGDSDAGDASHLDSESDSDGEVAGGDRPGTAGHTPAHSKSKSKAKWNSDGDAWTKAYGWETDAKASPEEPAVALSNDESKEDRPTARAAERNPFIDAASDLKEMDQRLLENEPAGEGLTDTVEMIMDKFHKFKAKHARLDDDTARFLAEMVSNQVDLRRNSGAISLTCEQAKPLLWLLAVWRMEAVKHTLASYLETPFIECSRMYATEVSCSIFTTLQGRFKADGCWANALTERAEVLRAYVKL